MATTAKRKRNIGLTYPIGTLVSIKNKENVHKGHYHFDLNQSVEAIIVENDCDTREEEQSYGMATVLYFQKKYNKKSKRSTYVAKTVSFETNGEDYNFEVKKLQKTNNPGLNRYHSWIVESSGSDARGRYFELGCQRIHLRDIVGYLRLTGQHLSNVGRNTKMFGPEDVFKAFQRFHTKA